MGNRVLNRPVLLPCDHVFCDSCIHKSSQNESSCPICKAKHSKKARRNLPFMESVISIYKSLDAVVSVHLPQLQNRNDAPNNSYVPKDGGSVDLEMIDRDDLPTLDHLPLYEFESENDPNNRTPESRTGQAAEILSDITASGKLNKAARKRICCDSLSHDDSQLPNSQESNTFHLTVLMLKLWNKDRVKAASDVLKIELKEKKGECHSPVAMAEEVDFR